MWLLLAFLTAGMVAQLVDGTLGMGFGVTNASFLLALGVAPAAASASVHVAEVFTTLASGASHVKFGNVDKRTLAWLAVPGCIGGAAGALALASFRAEGARPWVAAFLLVMGLAIIARVLRGKARTVRPATRTRTGLLGFAAASLDAMGGGGWGPIAMPGLILSGSHEPRKAVGTVNTAEFFVTSTIAATFLVVLGPAVVRWDFVAAVAIGGVLVAPVSAYLTTRVPQKSLGELVGVMLVALNSRLLAVDVLHADAQASAFVTLGAIAVLIGVLFLKALRHGNRPSSSPPKSEAA